MSKKKQTDKNEVEVGKERVDLITQKPTFDYYQRPTVGARFFIFKSQNDEITGKIIGHAITNVRRNSSYPLQLDNGEVIEFFANKLLHGIIKDYALVGCKVKIVYIGREHNIWGHAAKVYRVYRVEAGKASGVPLVKHLTSGKKSKKRRSPKNDERKTKISNLPELSGTGGPHRR